MLSLRGFLAPIRAHPQLLPLMLLVALVMSGSGIVSPILSLYAQSFSVGTTMVGMIITTFGIGRLIADFPAGVLSQRFGRKPLLCAGSAFVVVGAVGAALVDSFTALLVCRLVQGIGSGIYMTTLAAAMADLSKAGERGRVMALYQAALLLGSGIGPAIGGWLADAFGYTAPFWAYALAAAAALIVAWRSVDNPVAKSETQSEHGHAAMLGLLRNTAFLLLCLVNFGVFFTRTASQSQLIPLLGHDGFAMSVGLIGLALTVTSVANFLMLPITGALVDRFGARDIVVSATIANGLALALVALAPTRVWFFSGMAVLGVAAGLNGPAVAAHAADIMPRHLYGPAIGLQRAFGDAGFVLGPIMVGLLDDFGSVGYAGGILFNAAWVLASALAFWIYVRGAARKEAATPAD